MVKVWFEFTTNAIYKLKYYLNGLLLRQPHFSANLGYMQVGYINVNQRALIVD